MLSKLNKETRDRTRVLSLEARSIVSVADPDIVLAQATLTAGMLINEGLHVLANSIEKMGDREVAADTIAKALELLE